MLIMSFGVVDFFNDGANFLVGRGIVQSNVGLTYRKNVALRCGCIIVYCGWVIGLISSGHCTADSTCSRRVHLLCKWQWRGSSHITFLLLTVITVIMNIMIKNYYYNYNICWLGGRKGIRPVKTEWLCVWVKVQICRYSPADAIATHYLLRTVNPDWFYLPVLPFWCWLTRVAPEKKFKRAIKWLNGCVCVCAISIGYQRDLWVFLLQSVCKTDKNNDTAGNECFLEIIHFLLRHPTSATCPINNNINIWYMYNWRYEQCQKIDISPTANHPW